VYHSAKWVHKLGTSLQVGLWTISAMCHLDHLWHVPFVQPDMDLGHNVTRICAQLDTKLH